MSAGMGNDITSNLYADPLAVIPASGASVSQSARNLAVLDVTLTNNCAIGFADIPSGGAWSVKLIIRQDATGSRLATWPASTSWVKGVAPTLKTAASSVDLVELITTDGGSTWVGDYSTTPPTGTSTGAVGNLCVITNDGTTSQSLATNSATKIAAALPTVQSNIDGYWNTSTKEYKPTVAGKYLIMAAAQGIANSSLTAQIFKNGALESNGPAWAAYGYCSCAISTVVLMNGTTDYVDFRVFSTANTTINPAVGNTYFKAIFLGA